MSDKLTTHEMIQMLQDLQLELGRVPVAREFNAKFKGGEYQMKKHFGTYAVFLKAAGINKREREPRKIDNSIFERDLEQHLQDYKPREAKKDLVFPTMAVISDIHWPFDNPKVIEKFYKYVEEAKPEYVIINGDAWDFYSHSKYPRSHNEFTPREEERISREKNEAFWKKIQELSPQSKCVQMLGNHSIRPMKRILEAYPEAEDWIAEKLKSLFTFENVQTIHDPREELRLGDVLVFHGYRSQLGAHRDYVMQSCINGHTHRGGVVWKTVRGELIFEANSGVAGDPESKGLSYTPQKITEWTPGFLRVDRWGPAFVPA